MATALAACWRMDASDRLERIAAEKVKNNIRLSFSATGMNTSWACRSTLSLCYNPDIERKPNGFIQEKPPRRERSVLGSSRVAPSDGIPPSNRLGRNPENILAVDSDHVLGSRIRVNVLDGSCIESTVLVVINNSHPHVATARSSHRQLSTGRLITLWALRRLPTADPPMLQLTNSICRTITSKIRE